MKELKQKKETKKKPGEFQKQKKKFQNIQHNRDQLKLLNEKQILEAELFILDPDGFKKVTIVPLDMSNPHYDYKTLCYYGTRVVYLSHNGRGGKLRTAYLIEKDSGGRCKVDGEGFIEWDSCFGIIVKEEKLAAKKRAS
jgi:hypothetical protein